VRTEDLCYIGVSGEKLGCVRCAVPHYSEKSAEPSSVFGPGNGPSSTPTSLHRMANSRIRGARRTDWWSISKGLLAEGR
jgi:hypothetical protein